MGGSGEAGGGADHRRVVGAELDRDQLELDAAALAQLATASRSGAVGGDAAAQGDRPHSPRFSARSSFATS